MNNTDVVGLPWLHMSVELHVFCLCRFTYSSDAVAGHTTNAR